MSTTIDQRVVEMRFDNKQFESGARESMSTLEKLKQALNLSDSTKSFDNLQKAANNVSMDGLGGAVESVKLKFSALEVMAIAALSNIANQAVNAGTQLVKSLTIDQVTAGWDKYAKKTQAVQTIMSATAKDFTDTGEQMEYVNEQLDKLNWFTDETSYNFLEMVNSIGKFTNNNIKLDDAVTSMQGISTWAALAGANTEEAGRAMYNLSQAIAVGAVKLQDWKSIENANMATAEFKQIAMETAVELGILSDKFQILKPVSKYKGDMEVGIANFSQTLSSGWFTSDVLIETLSKYGKFTDALYDASTAMSDQYSTTNDLLRALDKYKEGTLDITEIMENTGLTAKEVTGYFDALADSTMTLGEKGFRAAQEAKTFEEAINATKDAVSTGWLNTFEMIFGNYQEAKVLWTDFSNFLYDVFAESGNKRNEILAAWKEAGGRDDLFDGIKAGWESLMSFLEPIKDAWEAIFPPKTIAERAERLVDLTKKFKEFMQGLKLGEKSSTDLERSFKGLFAVVDMVKNGFSAVVKGLSPLVGGFKSIGGAVLSVTATIGDFLVKINETAKEMGVFEAITQTVSTVVQAIGAGIQTIFGPSFSKVIKDFQDAGGGIQGVFASIKGVVERTIQAFRDLGKAISENEVIQNFGKKFAESMSEWTGIGSEAIDKLRDKFSSLRDKVKEFFESHKIDLGNIKESIVEFGKGIGESIESWISKTIDSLSKVKEKFNEIKEKIKEFFENLKGNFSKGKESVEAFSSTVENKFAPIKKVFEAIGGLLSDLGARLAKLFGGEEGFSLNSILKVVNSGILAAIGLEIRKFFKGLGDISIDVSKIIGNIKAIGDQLTATFKAIQSQLKAKALKDVAVAIGILTAALIALSYVDDGKLTFALTAITSLIVDLVAAMKILTSTFENVDIESLRQVSKSMIAFSGAILILTFALKSIAELSFGEIMKGLIGIAGLAAILDASIIAMTVASSQYSDGSIDGLIEFALAIILLTIPLKSIAKLTWDELIRGLTGVAALAIIMDGSIIALQAASNEYSDGSVDGLISFALAIILLTVPLKSIAKLSWDELMRGLTGVAALAIIMDASIIAMQKAASEYNEGSISGLLSFALAIILLTGPLKSIAKMDWEGLIKGLTGIAGLAAIMTVALVALQNAAGATDNVKMLETAASILVMAAAILVLTPALKALGNMSIEQLATGLGAIAAVFAILGVAGLALSPLAPVIFLLSESILMLGVAVAAAGIGILAFAAGLAALAAAGTAAAVVVVGVLGIIIVGILDIIASSISHITNAINAVIVALCDAVVVSIPTIISTILIVIDEVLASLAEHVPNIVSSILALVAGVIEAVAQGLPALVQSVVDLFVAFFTSIIDALGNIETGDLLKMLGGIGVVAAIMAAMAGLAALAPSAMVGILAMAAVVVELSLVMLALSALTEVINQGGDLFQAIGTMIGKFVGGIVGGFMSGVSSQFPQIAQDLSDFMTNLGPFLEGARDIDPAMFEGVERLVKVILLLTAAELLNGLTSWLTGSGASLADFGQQLADFGPKFKEYADSVDGIKPEVVTASANAAKAMAEMAKNLPRDGGVVGWFAGDRTSLSAFAEELADFGPAIKDYADSVDGLKADVVENSANAALAMANVANNLPDHGGVKGWFMGDSSLTGFAEELADFGPAIKDYADSVDGLKADVVENSANAAKAMTEVATGIPNQGGALAWIVGDNTLSQFGAELQAFGPAFAKYAESVKDVKPDVVVASANAAEALISIANAIPNSGGIVSWFTGDNDIGKFGQSLEKFGKAIYAYYQSVKDIQAEDLGAIIGEVENLINIAKSAAGIDMSGMSGFAKGLQSLANVSIDAFVKAFTDATSKVTDGINSMLNSSLNAVSSKDSEFELKGANSANAWIKAFQAKYGDADATGRTIATKAISALQNQIVNFTAKGTASATAFLKAIKDKYGEATTTGTGFSEAVLKGCDSLLSSFRDSGATSADRFAEGITLTRGAAEIAGYDLANAAISGLNSAGDGFYSAGSNAGSGFASGISSMKSAVASAGSALGQAALEAAKAALDINSPSKEMAKVGDYAGLGFVNKLMTYTSIAAKAGMEVGIASLDGINSAIVKGSDIFGEDLDLNPVITPTVDMSDVEESADTIMSLFNKSIEVALDKANAASSGISIKKSNDETSTDSNDKNSKGNSYTFNQYNNSPKELSRIEIYRATKNQFAQFKEAVEES